MSKLVVFAVGFFLAFTMGQFMDVSAHMSISEMMFGVIGGVGVTGLFSFLA